MSMSAEQTVHTEDGAPEKSPPPAAILAESGVTAELAPPPPALPARAGGQASSDRPYISIVVPVYNEVENVGPLVATRPQEKPLSIAMREIDAGLLTIETVEAPEA